MRLLDADCVEDNWGHIWDDSAYLDPTVVWHHALLALAFGSRTCSVYAACATWTWPGLLDLEPDALRAEGTDPARFTPPYCPGAPMREDGTTSPNLYALHSLKTLLDDHGREMLRTELAADVLLVVGPSAHRHTVARAAQVCAALMIEQGLTCDIVSSVDDPRTTRAGTLMLVTADAGDPVVAATWWPWAVRRAASGRPTAWVGRHDPTQVQGPLKVLDADFRLTATVASLAGLWDHASPTRRAHPDGMLVVRRRVPNGAVFHFMFNRTDHRRSVRIAGVGLSADELTLRPREAVMIRHDANGLRACGQLHLPLPELGSP